MCAPANDGEWERRKNRIRGAESFFKVLRSVTDFSIADFEGATVVLPAVSVGNVGQLAIDVLTTTYPDIKKIGYLYSRHVLPFAANDFDDEKFSRPKLMLPVEIYFSQQKKVVLIQQRSPEKLGHQKAFAESLVNWISECKFKSAILLTSAQGFQQFDLQLSRFSAPCTYFCSQNSSLKNIAQELLFTLHVDPKPNDRPLFDDSISGLLRDVPVTVNQARKLTLRELTLPCGITHYFYEFCCRQNIDMIGLLSYSNEGVNDQDGIKMAYQCDVLISRASNDSPQQRFKVPKSWEHMFGPPPAEDGLYL